MSHGSKTQLTPFSIIAADASKMISHVPNLTKYRRLTALQIRTQTENLHDETMKVSTNLLWCVNGCTRFRLPSLSVHTYWTVVKGWMGISRKQQSCDEVWRDVGVFLIPPTLCCRYSRMHLSNLPVIKWKCHWEPAEDAGTCLPEKTVITFTRPGFKLPFKMHWAVTGTSWMSTG